MENLHKAIEITHEGDSWIDPTPTIARVVLQQVKKTKSVNCSTDSVDNNPLNSREIDPLNEEAQQLIIFL